MHTLELRYEEDTRDGPTVSDLKVEQEICGASVYSMSIYEGLTPDERNQLVLAVVCAIRTVVDGATAIKLDIGENKMSSTPTSPKDVVECSDAVFRTILARHESRLIGHFGDTVMTDVWNQRKILREHYRTLHSFRRLVDRASASHVDEAWAEVNETNEFAILRDFIIGLASIAPGTHTVESDFSVLKRIKNKHRNSLRDYSLEGELQAVQYFELVSLATGNDPR